MLEQDAESAWLDLDPAEDTDAMPQILGSSITYRIAVGPQQGRKAFMIRTIRPLDKPDPGLERVAKASGFSLHAGVSCEGHQKNKRERLCRYIARPAVAIPRLSQSSTSISGINATHAANLVQTVDCRQPFIAVHAINWCYQ